jgi:hypothetical protein
MIIYRYVVHQRKEKLAMVKSWESDGIGWEFIKVSVPASGFGGQYIEGGRMSARESHCAA